MSNFNGLGMNLGNLSLLSAAKTRSISPENFTGEKGKAGMATEGTGANAGRDLGQGWKISPSIRIEPGECRELANISGSGAIQQIWMTPTSRWRNSIIRMYWDDQEQPSVECPVGDFFTAGWQSHAQNNSLAVCVNPGSAFNCYWEMPFRKRCRITFTNIGYEAMTLYYQINYTLTDVPENCAYFHAQFRRTNPLPYKQDYTILDGVKGQGQYVGTYMAWGVNNVGWWGEGEIKFFMDGDTKFPTIRRHRHGGLFLRLLQFREPSDQAVPGIHHALRRPAPGHQAGRCLQIADALRHVPLAHHRPGALHQRPEGDDAGTRLARRGTRRRPLPAAAGRHRLGRVLVPGAADRAVPRAAGPGLFGSDLGPADGSKRKAVVSISGQRLFRFRR
jgi:hypothetical protein